MKSTLFLAPTSRRLGSSDITVSPLGLGCWPIGGKMSLFGRPDSYGTVDDEESIRAIHAATAEGVTFFDTADCYGGGHSERVLGRALRGASSEIVIATKAGYLFDPESRNIHGESHDPAYYRAACEASLRRLGRDVIDLFQVHLWSAPAEAIAPIVDALERLKTDGLIRAYGWSTDHLETISTAAQSGRLCTLQHEMSVFHRADDALRFCREHHLGSIVRSPLAMGLLSGKYARKQASPSMMCAARASIGFATSRTENPCPRFSRDSKRSVKSSRAADARWSKVHWLTSGESPP